MPRAEMFGLRAKKLPPELEDLLVALEEHDPKGSFRAEAKYYWKEACGMQFEQRNSFVAHAVEALRYRFQVQFRKIEEE